MTTIQIKKGIKMISVYELEQTLDEMRMQYVVDYFRIHYDMDLSDYDCSDLVAFYMFLKIKEEREQEGEN